MQSFASYLLSSYFRLGSPDLRNGRGIKYEKFISRKVQDEMQRKYRKFSILGPLKQNRNHYISHVRRAYAPKDIIFIFSNDEAWTRWNQSVAPDCTSEESLMILLHLFIALSLSVDHNVFNFLTWTGIWHCRVLLTFKPVPHLFNLISNF